MKDSVSIKDGLLALKDGMNFGLKGDLFSRKLKIDLIIQSSVQPRRHFDQQAIEELANSIKAQGIIQPIVVRRTTQDKFEIISGERRWRAAKLAGLTEVPVEIKDISDRTAIAIALIENIQREDLNPIEEAEAIKKLITESMLTHEEVATELGKPRSSISNALRLLELEPVVRDLVTERKITMGHAKVLLALNGHEQIEAAKKIVSKGLNVRQTEQLVKKFVIKDHTSNDRPETSLELERFLRDSEQKIFDLLEIKNTIKMNKYGKGCINISFETERELRNIIKMIGDRVND